MSGDRVSLRSRAEFAIYLVARAVARRLGPRASARVGATLGDLFLALSATRRRVALFNIRLAFPELGEGERRRMARQSGRHFGRVALEVLRMQTMEPASFLEGLSVFDQQRAVDLAARGEGVIFMTAHLGLWEVCALGDSLLRGQTMHVVNRPLDNPLLEDELARFRRRFGYEPLGKRGVMRAIVSELTSGGSVGFLIDQRAAPNVGISVPLFGHPACTHPVLARVVRRTGAPVMPFCALWDGPGAYSLHYFEPLLPDALSEDQLEDEPLTARFNQIIEAMIRRRPEQWLWYHDRWRDLRLKGS